ncbi:MAG: hypothetical protein RJB11_2764, partial [Planctomycetota bacterium]
MKKAYEHEPLNNIDEGCALLLIRSVIRCRKVIGHCATNKPIGVGLAKQLVDRIVVVERTPRGELQPSQEESAIKATGRGIYVREVVVAFFETGSRSCPCPFTEDSYHRSEE